MSKALVPVHGAAPGVSSTEAASRRRFAGQRR
jgi:hypothetical protein